MDIVVTRSTSPDGVGVGARDGKDTMNACMRKEMENSSGSVLLLLLVSASSAVAESFFVNVFVSERFLLRKRTIGSRDNPSETGTPTR